MVFVAWVWVSPEDTGTRGSGVRRETVGASRRAARFPTVVRLKTLTFHEIFSRQCAQSASADFGEPHFLQSLRFVVPLCDVAGPFFNFSPPKRARASAERRT
jgi:hypothetical protein